MESALGPEHLPGRRPAQHPAHDHPAGRRGHGAGAGDPAEQEPRHQAHTAGWRELQVAGNADSLQQALDNLGSIFLFAVLILLILLWGVFAS